MAAAQRRQAFKALPGGRRSAGKTGKQVFDYDTGMLPCNPEAEAITIGATLDWAANGELAELLEPHDFYQPHHETIWQAITDLHLRGEPITTVAVNALLSTRGELALVGGQSYISSLTTRAEVTNGRQYAKIVFDRARERAAMQIGAELVALATEASEDMEGVLAYHRARLAELEERALAFEPSAKRLPGVLASMVKPRAIDWLWPRRIAYGKLALLDGDPGLGKGLIGVDLTARLTTGTPLPGETDTRRRAPQNVLLVTPEDDPDDTIVPRLIAAGADLERVRIMTSLPTETVNGVTGERPFSLPRDTPMLERVVREHGAAFVIIDPIMGCLDLEFESKSDQAVRAALMPLKLMVERLRIACLLVRHLNKSGGDKAIYRGGGSIAFTGLCRTTLLIAEHPDDRSQRVLAGVKTNIGKLPISLAFSVVADEGDEDNPRLSWSREAVAYDANSLLGARKSDERLEVIKTLQTAAPLTMSPHEVAEALGVAPEKESNIRRLLAKMLKAGDVRQPSYGVYTV